MAAVLPAVGRYVLHRRIARGGMAEVYLASPAESDSSEDFIAIKRIRPEFSDDPSFVRMFLDEARISRLLRHPNIARLKDFGESDGSPYLVIEFVSGASLKQLIRVNHLPAELAAEVGVAVAEALHAAHDQCDENGRKLGIVHRDVTPQNVMVTFDGQVKLLDFGIALARVRAERTRTGVLKGKWAYMSPEQVQGRRVDRRSDIFSLGALIYETATGRRAFDGESPSEVLNAVLLRIPLALDLLESSLPDELAAVLKRCLAKEPEHRYATAADVADALREYLASPNAAPQAGLSAFVRGTVPELEQQVTSTQKEIETQAAAENPLVDESPTLVEPAPFEAAADDLEESGPVLGVGGSPGSGPGSSPKIGQADDPDSTGRIDNVPDAPASNPSLVVALMLVLGAAVGLGAAFTVWHYALAP